MANFNILKLELLHSFAHHIKLNGTLIQYIVDVSKQLLITHCKASFECMSYQSHNFVDQVVQILNYEETIHCFDLYHLLHDSNIAFNNAVCIEDKKVTTINLT